MLKIYYFLCSLMVTHVAMYIYHFDVVSRFWGLIFLQDSDDAGPLEKLRSQICDNIALYAQKYDEEFQVILNYFL